MPRLRGRRGLKGAASKAAHSSPHLGRERRVYTDPLAFGSCP